MFDFLKTIDIKLISVISQLENDIKYKSGNTIVTIQTFCELLMKDIEFEEVGVKRTRKPLGQYLDDESFADVLINDLYIDTQKLSLINRTANQVKHDGVYKYNDTEIKDYVEFLFNISKNVLSYYYEIDSNDFKYDPNYYDNIRKSLEIDNEKIKQHYVEQMNEKTREYEIALSNAISQKEILEKRIKETEKEKDNYKEQIDNLDRL